MTIANALGFFQGRLEDALRPQVSAVNFWRYQKSKWAVLSYAHAVGLDNRWEMFSYLPRFTWWFIFKAKYEDGELDRLSIPLQASRNFFERNFFDFKEAKFHWNIYSNANDRLPYIQYLCRQSSTKKRATSIVVELHHMMVSPPEVARETGQVFSPPSSRVLEEVACL